MDGWRRLARFASERRLDLGLTQEDVRARGGPSTATMRLIEGGLQDGYSERTLSKLEQVLEWQRGSVKAALEGGEPTTRAAIDALFDRLDRTNDQEERAHLRAELARWLAPAEESPPEPRELYHPELGKINDPQDIEVWQAKTIPEDQRIEWIFQLRAKRTREASRERRRAA